MRPNTERNEKRHLTFRSSTFDLFLYAVAKLAKKIMEAKVLSSFRATDGMSRRQFASTSQKESREYGIGDRLQCGNTVSTGSGSEGNKAVSGRQSHCCGLDDVSARKAKEAIAGFLRSTGVPVSGPDSIQLGHLDNPGPPGHTPEELGICDMRTRAPCDKDGITNSPHIGFLQTTSLPI